MLAIIAGTRPELLKLASLFKILKESNDKYLFIWTGQHYDYEMSRVFIEELSLPEPDITLNTPRQGELQRLAFMMYNLHDVFKRKGISLAASLGDTDSVVASALASARSGIPFIHIESGYRSWDLTMPEEINRIIADHVAAFLFAPTALSYLNLVHEGIPRNYISLSGSPLIDTVYEFDRRIQENGEKVLDKLGLEKENYLLVTIHRKENVDRISNLRIIVETLLELAASTKIVFPVHPRTRRRLEEFRLLSLLTGHRNIIVTKPLDYFSFIGLLRNSYATITDSGGVLEEAMVYRIPIIIPRKTIEKPEILLIGLGVLTGPEKQNIIKAFRSLTRVREKLIRNMTCIENPFGDGMSGRRIHDKIIELIETNDFRTKEPDFREIPVVKYVLMKKYALSYMKCMREDLYYYNDRGESVVDKREASMIGSRLRCKVDNIWLKEYSS